MRILIADDHGIVREGLKLLINKQADMEVIGEAEDGLTAARLAKELVPDIVIMDISMPNLSGIQATQLIRRENPNTKIVVLSMYFNRNFVMETLNAGALGYVLKSCVFDELLRAIRTVAANEHYLSPRIADILVEDYISNQRAANNESIGSRLTSRECQILQLLTEGMSIKRIALRLNISPKTADANRRQLMDKLGISSVAELTKYAIREGLTSTEF